MSAWAIKCPIILAPFILIPEQQSNMIWLFFSLKQTKKWFGHENTMLQFPELHWLLQVDVWLMIIFL